MQALTPVNAAGTFNACFAVVALEEPSALAAFKITVGNPVPPARQHDFDIVDQAFTRAQQMHLQLIGRVIGVAVVQHAGGFDGGPRGLGGFIAIRPIRRLVVVGMGIYQFEAAATAVAPFAPASTTAIHHFIHGAEAGVRYPSAEFIGGCRQGGLR